MPKNVAQKNVKKKAAKRGAKKTSRKVGNQPLAIQASRIPTFRVPIGWIEISDEQTRSEITAEGLEELAQSMEVDYQLQAIVLVRVGPDGPGAFLVCAGQRRLLAATSRGWTHIEAQIREGLTRTEAMYLSFIENAAREHMSILDEARQCERLLKEGQRVAQIATRLGKGSDVSWVYKRLRVLKLPKEILDRIRNSRLGPTATLMLIEVIDETTSSKIYNPLIRKLDAIGWKMEHVRHAVRELKRNLKSPRNTRARGITIDPRINLENKSAGVRSAIDYLTEQVLSGYSKDTLRHELLSAYRFWREVGNYTQRVARILGEGANQAEAALKKGGGNGATPVVTVVATEELKKHREGGVQPKAESAKPELDKFVPIDGPEDELELDEFDGDDEFNDDTDVPLEEKKDSELDFNEQDYRELPVAGGE